MNNLLCIGNQNKIIETEKENEYGDNIIIVDTEDEGSIPLKSLGSGANWVGIHLLVYFAFQKYFIKKNRPVPSFILLDQPSQIYFPNDTNTIDWDSVPFCKISNEDRAKYILRKGDIVVARTGATVGYAKYIKNDVPTIKLNAAHKWPIWNTSPLSEYLMNSMINLNKPYAIKCKK